MLLPSHQTCFLHTISKKCWDDFLFVTGKVLSLQHWSVCLGTSKGSTWLLVKSGFYRHSWTQEATNGAFAQCILLIPSFSSTCRIIKSLSRGNIEHIKPRFSIRTLIKLNQPVQMYFHFFPLQNRKVFSYWFWNSQMSHSVNIVSAMTLKCSQSCWKSTLCSQCISTISTGYK